MSIDIQPGTEQVIRDEIRKGHFTTVDEIILAGVEAWHRQHGDLPVGSQARKAVVQRAIDHAKTRAVRVEGVSIRDLIHAGHRI